MVLVVVVGGILADGNEGGGAGGCREGIGGCDGMTPRVFPA